MVEGLGPVKWLMAGGARSHPAAPPFRGSKKICGGRGIVYSGWTNRRPYGRLAQRKI